MADKRVTVTNEALLDVLGQLGERLDDMTPAMRPISQVLLDSIEHAYATQADPATATTWQELAARTIEQREERGYWPGKIMQQTGQLAASETAAYGPRFAEAGSNKVYAAIQHFGGQAGRARATTIPARPRYALSPIGEADVLDIVARYLLP